MKKRTTLLINMILLLLLISTNAFSQLDNTIHGKDFWVSFGHNYDRPIIDDPIDGVAYQIRIIATGATTVTFNFTNISTTRTFNLTAGQIFTYKLTVAEATSVFSNATGLTNKSLHITSTEYISVFAMNLSYTTSEGTHVLPVTALGTEYYQVSYEGFGGIHTINNNCGDGYTIIAIENGTVITEQSGNTVNMSKGQVYSRYFGNYSDATGYKLTSNKPVAYFVTNWGVVVPKPIWSGDCLFEQMMPVHTWGTRFLVPVSHRNVENVRVVAAQNNTNVHYMDQNLTDHHITLNAGAFAEFRITRVFDNSPGVTLTSDKPVAVCAYMVGQQYNVTYPGMLNDWAYSIGGGNDQYFGDPALAWIPPLDQSVKEVTISPFFAVGSSILEPNRHIAIIMTPTATKNNTTVAIGNGAPAPLPIRTGPFFGDWDDDLGKWFDKWDNEVKNRYSYYLLQMTQDAAYHISNPAGVIILGYGLGYAESYYYLTASSTRALDMLFYVNDEHYQDVDGKIYCNGPFTIKSEFHLPVNAGNPTYLRWYINGVEDVSKRNTVQWTQPTFPVGPVEIKMVVIDANNITYTKTTTIIHDPQHCITTPLDPGEIGTNQTICSGATPAALTSITAASGGTGTITYNWQKSTDGGTTWVNADGTRNQATYTPPALTATTQYRRQATASGTTVNSNVITVTVAAAMNAGAIGTNQTICSGATPAALTSTTAASGGTGTITYNWQKSTDGGSTWANADGTRNQATYTPPALTATTHYRRQATTTCGTVNTGSVIITVGVCANAVPDTVSVIQDGQVLIDVLANDLIPAACLPVTTLTVTTNPTQGTAVVNGNKILYSPAANFAGKDSLEYSFICSGNTYTAKVYINVFEKPDNISDVDCFTDPPSTPFTFIELMRSPNPDVHALTTPLVGDIDGDGLIEVVVARHTGSASTTGIHIFKIHPDNTLTLQQTIETPNFFAEGGAPYAIANVDGGPYAAIFLATDIMSSTSGDRMQLIKYTYDGTTYSEDARRTYSNTDRRQTPSPILADFNGDGIAEIVVYDKVYNARTMVLIADGNYINDPTKGFGEGGHPYDNFSYVSSGSFLAAADMDGDGLPEVCGGNSVYKVNITNPNGQSGNDFTLWSQCDRYDVDGIIHDEAYDGTTSVADIDGDGFLDIVVTVRCNKNLANPTHSALYAWNPRTKKVINTNIIADLPPHAAGGNGLASGASIAFIGDIDNDGEPEICITAQNLMNSYKYNKTTKTLDVFWSQSTSDFSAATTMVLFDFNQDGKNELVYRDMSHLRIIDGTTGQDVIPPIPCGSNTGSECPIVADVNGDGSAEIIVTGGITTSAEWAGYLRVFSSNPAGLWAPARKVWNQFAYNAVNVNEDLTIPRYQMNPATVFAGGDGVLGTPDDVRPYNAFLQQQTILNKNGTPLWLAPNGRIVNNSLVFNYDPTIDSVTITIKVYNAGDAAFQTPFYVTTYRNSIGSTPKYTYEYNEMIYPRDTATITFGIPNFKTQYYTSGFNGLVIQINDNGDGTNYQAVCNDQNRSVFKNNIIAIDDRYLVFENSQNNLFDVIKNDLFPAGCNPVITIISAPSHGSATVGSGSNSNKIDYTPTADYLGGDTLRYRLYCSSSPSVYDEATVYFSVVPNPDNISDADCTVTPVGTIWDMEEVQITPFDVNRDILNPHSDLLVGDLNDDGIPEIVGVSETGFELINAISIFDNHGVFIKKINTVPMNMFSGKIGMAKVKTSANTYKTIIVVAGSDDYLYAYDYYSTTHIWKSNATYNRLGIGIAGIGFADFNNDGYTEVYANNAIFDAATGVLLCRGTGKKGAGVNFMNATAHITIAADIDGDGKLELLAGTDVYSVNITNRTGTAGNTITVNQSLPPFTMENGTTVAPADGITTIADMDLDGYPDMVVQNIVGNKGYLYVWSPHKNQMLARKTIPTVTEAMGVPLIGDIDGDGRPEIVFMTVDIPDNVASAPKLWAFKYDGTTTLKQFWVYDHLDRSGFTGITLFDFNQDGISEIVFRDNADMRIMNASGKSHITGNDTLSSGIPIIYDLVKIPCPSATSGEYPIVADLGEGTRILTTVVASAYGNRLRIFKQGQYPWAPSRKVWNQYAYFSVNVNEDLTIPKNQFNPATLFPGFDGILGTSDDQRPYNAFLQQQTVLSKKGTPMWPAPDARVDQSTSTLTVSGDDLIINACFTNIGDAAIGPHIYVTLYRNSISLGNILAMDSANIVVGVGESGCVTVRIPNAKSIAGMNNIYARINDRNGNFAYYAECDSLNNELRFINPFLMTKNATLLTTPSLAHNGTYPNPVSVLYNEEIKYDITAVNANFTQGTVVITDTIPSYLSYVSGSANPTSAVHNSIIIGSVSHDRLVWTFTNVSSMASQVVSFKATPQSGSVASQPLFINKAWVKLDNQPQLPTNSTYHQGAGISITTFSVGYGGHIYNAEDQALDYMTSPRTGVVIVPEDGYRFAGWSHRNYASLRGVEIKSQEGIMHYDSLTIYGDVELHANFELEEYPVNYYLNGSENAKDNPEKYTIKSGTFELEEPQKAGDTFVGWTGSNGDEPQKLVVIANGSTGELAFYANFLLSGREGVEPALTVDNDNVWAVDDNLYIKTTKTGSIVRVYSLDGILREQLTIVSPGVTTRKFPRGIYVININNAIGRKIKIE